MARASGGYGRIEFDAASTLIESIPSASIPGFELDIAADSRILGHRSSSKLDVEPGADANKIKKSC